MNKIQLLLQRFFNQPLVRNHLGIFFIYILVFILGKFINEGLGLFYRWQYLLTLLGAFLGMYVGVVDRLVYAYMTQPTDPFSLQLKNLVTQHRYLEMIKVAHEDRQNFRKLSTNNILFIGVWVVLALFVLTSSLSYFGQGLVMGIGLVLFRDMIRDLSSLETLKHRLFWPIERELTDHETKLVAYIFCGIFCFLSLLFVS